MSSNKILHPFTLYHSPLQEMRISSSSLGFVTPCVRWKLNKPLTPADLPASIRLFPWRMSLDGQVPSTEMPKETTDVMWALTGEAIYQCLDGKLIEWKGMEHDEEVLIGYGELVYDVSDECFLMTIRSVDSPA